MGFNRTFMELKSKCQLLKIKDESFNRTFMELKLCIHALGHSFSDGFNRTFMELKSSNVRSVEAGK